MEATIPPPPPAVQPMRGKLLQLENPFRMQMIVQIQLRRHLTNVYSVPTLTQIGPGVRKTLEDDKNMIPAFIVHRLVRRQTWLHKSYNGSYAKGFRKVAESPRPGGEGLGEVPLGTGLQV